MWATIEDIEKQRVIHGLQERLDKYIIEVVDKSGNSNWDFYFIDYDKIPSPVITLFIIHGKVIWCTVQNILKKQ